MLNFLEELPRKIEIPRPLFLGSDGRYEVYVEGYGLRSSIIREISNLDEPFDPNMLMTRTVVMRPQDKDLRAEIFGTLHQQLQKGFRRLCYLQASGGCKGGIVRAHTIQESLLREVSVDGHLLEFNPLGHTDPETRHYPRKVGVDRATTFEGFCAYHDNAVFKPIEGEFLNSSPEELFLYAYRALCANLYTMEVKFEILKAPLEAVRALTTAQSLQRHDTTIALNDLDLQELAPIKNEWDRWLAARDFAHLEHLVLECPKTPDLFVTAFYAPRKDFMHVPLQDCKSLGRLDWVTFTLLPVKGGGGVLVLSGRKGSRVFARYAESLLKYSPEKRTMALVNVIVTHFETTIISPRWWDSLTESQRKSVVRAITALYYPRHLRGLCDWGPFKQQQ